MKKTLILISLLCVGFYLSGQNLYVQPISGEQEAFSLVDRPTITFDDKTMTIQGTSFPLNNVRILSFVANHPTTIATLFESEQIIVFPNPVSDELSIVVENPQGLSFRIFDMLGQQLMSDQIRAETTTVNVQNFRAGVYVLHILRNGQSIQVFQIVKN